MTKKIRHLYLPVPCANEARSCPVKIRTDVLHSMDIRDWRGVYGTPVASHDEEKER